MNALNAVPLHLPTIHALSQEAMGLRTNSAISGAAAATFPAANRAVLIPVTIYETINVVRLWALNGTAVAGNIDIGIYNADFVRLVSAGSTAQAGVSTMQTFAVAATLSPGLHYLAVALSSTSGTLLRLAPLAAFCKSWGMRQMTSAFPLPAIITPEAPASGYVPMIGLLHGEDTIL